MIVSAQGRTGSTAGGRPNGAVATLHPELAATLERLSQLLMMHVSGRMHLTERDSCTPGMEEIQETARFLGQVTAAWADVTDDQLPAVGAGFGSTIVAEDMDQGVREQFTLMTGPLLDLDGGQVSLASPVGQALLGATPGDVVHVKTPQRLRRLRVVALRTLHDVIGEHEPMPAA